MPGDDANTNQFIKEILQKMEKLQIENDEFRKKCDKADKEKVEWRKEKVEFLKENVELRKENVEFGKDNVELRKDNVEFEKDNVELRKKIDKVNKEKDELQENFDQLQKNNNELQETNDDLIEEIRRKNEIIEQAFAKINERQRTIWEDEERNPRTKKLDYEEFMSLVAELSPSELFDIDSLDQNHLSSRSTNTIKVIGIFKGIESCEQELYNLVEQKRNDRFSKLKKVLKFPSRSWIKKCFKMDYKKLPENEIELVLTVYCTTIMIVTAAVNAILKASHLDITVSYRPVISKELENSCAKYLDENMPSDVLTSVRYLRPDGCYVIKDNKLIMIAEYKSVQKITREDYEQFIHYLEAHKNEKPSPVENYSEGIASDNTNFNKYMAFFHQMHNYKTKFIRQRRHTDVWQF